MDAFQKKLVMAVAILTAIVVTIASCMAYSVFVAPNRLQVTSMSLKSDKIPAAMDDVTIVYFSDLEYGKMEDKARARNVFSTIKELNPSILIFGGDLFDQDAQVSKKDMEQMAGWFKKINAPLGKFAVLGEMDTKNTTRISRVRQVYKASQVEVLDNANVLLSNGTGSGIHLVGVSPQTDWMQAFSGIPKGGYNLVVSHYTDPLLQDAQAFEISQALCGNAHGTQINWPVAGGYRLWKGSEKLNRGERVPLDFPCYISSGTGCTRVNARFNAPAEVVYLVLSAR